MSKSIESRHLTEAAAGLAGDGGARSDLAEWPRPEPLDKEPMAGALYLEVGEDKCAERPGGLKEPAGGFGCEWDEGLRGRAYVEDRGDVYLPL